MRCRTGLTLALTLAALAAVPAGAAAAGTVSSNGTTVTYAGDGGANNVTVTYAAATYTFAETGIGAGAGCTDNGNTATCSDAAASSVTMNLGGSGDIVEATSVSADPFTINGEAGVDLIRASAVGDTINGGPGDDRSGTDMGLVGQMGNDTINGGDGNDYIFGGAGDDGLNGDLDNDRLEGSDDADDYDGGPGIDRALFGGGGAGCTFGPITVTIDNAANDTGCRSAADTGNNVRDTVESVTGTELAGSGDSITGSCLANTIAGDPGIVPAAASGADTLNGDPDTCAGGNGADFMGGGEGDDTFNGDGTTGSPGVDTVTYGVPFTGVGGLTVTLDDAANDSDGYGNTDNVHGDINRVIGNGSGDTINAAGAEQAVQLFGRNGNDTLTDSAFDDLLDGEDGTDTVNCTNGGTDSYRNAETITGSCEVNLGGNPPGEPLNVVMIYSDDQRFDSMDLMPETTARLGGETVKFQNAYATTPTCCASRATLLTGQYAPHHGVLENFGPQGGDEAFDPSSALPVWLDQAGYRTGIFGKYLNGYACDGSDPIPPGWSEWHVLCNLSYFNYTLNDNGTLQAFGSSANPANYQHRVLTSRANSFIQTTPDDEPLFMYFAPFGPHEPSVPDPQDASATVPAYAPSPNYNEADVSDKPDWVQDLSPVASEVPTPATRYRDIARTLLSVDRSVGDLLDTLEAEDRLDNTLILYMSDNGMSLGNHSWYLHDGNEYGAKECIYEECAKVPLWMRLPSEVSRTDTSHIVGNVDLAPTILDAANVTPPATVNGHPIDGQSLIPIGENPAAPWRQDTLVEMRGSCEVNDPLPDDCSTRAEQLNWNVSSVRSGQYIYGEYQNGDRELYDLTADPFELNNLCPASLNFACPGYEAVQADMDSRLAALTD